MSTPYDYNVIANLNMNIRVSRDIVLMNEFGEEISRTPDIQYSQVMLDLSDIQQYKKNMAISKICIKN